MGRYSRKDMIEFANFAKSYQSPRNVNEAYKRYLKGERIVTKTSPMKRVRQAAIVYLDNKIIKTRYNIVDRLATTTEIDNSVVESWNKITGVLFLKSTENEKEF
jgi:hypothetical protein